ncbi:NUDIX hydrolase [Nocardioides flavescens]|uniref:NUDIX domain-containing protein n=1 Tax=Nocardioides flavescens TaxID=2691959 RepID=A0A6L7F0D5_9ACTN|nr:NUDIX hydrolase [Nocardioides flavescens]MXG89871.1 NUDIX domain-containing protein [Nocardioides flavescens]
MPSGHQREIVAAGAVVLGPGRTVLLVHRPKYDDWSFPKGKQERGEHVTATAVREVEEETGVRIRLGLPLPSQRYRVRDGDKVAHYWIGRAVSGDVAAYEPNVEVDEVAWVPADKARRLLTHPRDAELLDTAIDRRRKTRALVVVRHSQARSRKAWRHDDRERPLLATGRAQAERLVPVLAAYDVTRVVTSTSTRCCETVAPYVAAGAAPGRAVEEQRVAVLSEEDAGRRRVRTLVREVVDDAAARPASAGAVALCSHRPVLPWVFEALGLDDPALAPGEMVVVHLRGGEVRAVERHRVR